MRVLQKDFPGASLRLQCAEYPSDDSREALTEVKQAINECDLEQFVTLDTAFLPIEEVRSRIRRADIAVLPYDESDEGGSASAVTCFETGLPLIVSKAQIFHEVRDYSGLLERTDPETIAKSIHEILVAPEIYESLVDKMAEYNQVASWQNVTKRYIEILGR